MEWNEKTRFFLKNLLQGVMWLTLLVVAFLILKNRLDVDYVAWLSPIYESPAWVYLIYSASELFFGIVPPEIFMIWGLRSGNIIHYALIVLLLACISYCAGVVGFFFGAYLNRTTLFKKLKRKVFGKYEKYLTRFGAFLIVVAALTPIPFSGVSMLIGSVHFPWRKYCLFALTRFLRYGVYSFVIWKANML